MTESADARRSKSQIGDCAGDEGAPTGSYPTGARASRGYDVDADAELFQRSLFATYEIAVEFDRRLKHLDRLIATTAADDDRSKLVERFALAIILCPLRLMLDRQSLEVTRCGFVENTREAVYQFTYKIPYEGDTELWSLAPASAPCTVDSQPGGEVYRQQLIVVVMACTAVEAEGWLNRTLDAVEFILAAQARDVEAFNESVRPLIRRKLMAKTVRPFADLPPAPDTVH
ncbi:MAG TPA: hypothetical protein VEC11_01250 [Allosphingosinicella sp.]|nr:hypothetical protein [Allosphingosinicella sp.]